MVIDQFSPDEGITLKREDVLMFKAPGRPLNLEDIRAEYSVIKSFFEKPLTAEIAARVCSKSGTHLVKLVSSRIDGDHSVLRARRLSGDTTAQIFLPSVNAPDIPFAKIIFRPLEVIGHPTRSLVDHILLQDDISENIFDAFVSVFGQDVFDAVMHGLTTPLPDITMLSDSEFPIIFIPSPSGGDLQITPLSPASAFMGFKSITGEYYQKQVKGEPRVPRGKWHRQAISSKPQNISGAIGGPRLRFLAEIPKMQGQYEAELFRFIKGGSFPRWHNHDVTKWIMKCADLIDASETFNNKDMRDGLNRLIDRVICEADAFIAETLLDASLMAEEMALSFETPKSPLSIQSVILRRFWAHSRFDVARRVLNGDHFSSRVKKHLKRGAIL